MIYSNLINVKRFESKIQTFPFNIMSPHSNIQNEKYSIGTRAHKRSLLVKGEMIRKTAAFPIQNTEMKYGWLYVYYIL